MGVDKSISGNIIANPILWFLTRTAARGAQTVLWAATDPNLSASSGKLFSNMKVSASTAQLNVFHKLMDGYIFRNISLGN